MYIVRRRWALRSDIQATQWIHGNLYCSRTPQSSWTSMCGNRSVWACYCSRQLSTRGECLRIPPVRRRPLHVISQNYSCTRRHYLRSGHSGLINKEVMKVCMGNSYEHYKHLAPRKVKYDYVNGLNPIETQTCYVYIYKNVVDVPVLQIRTWSGIDHTEISCYTALVHTVTITRSRVGFHCKPCISHAVDASEYSTYLCMDGETYFECENDMCRYVRITAVFLFNMFQAETTGVQDEVYMDLSPTFWFTMPSIPTYHRRTCWKPYHSLKTETVCATYLELRVTYYQRDACADTTRDPSTRRYCRFRHSQRGAIPFRLLTCAGLLVARCYYSRIYSAGTSGEIRFCGVRNRECVYMPFCNAWSIRSASIHFYAPGNICQVAALYNLFNNVYGEILSSISVCHNKYEE